MDTPHGYFYSLSLSLSLFFFTGDVCEWTCGECDAIKGHSQYQPWCYQHNDIQACQALNATCEWVSSSSSSTSTTEGSSSSSSVKYFRAGIKNVRQQLSSWWKIFY